MSRIVLNQKQQEAVTSDPGIPVKIEAGAGTGKTLVLVSRYLKLVLDDGVEPERILALTFTRRAASEMRRRIFEEIRETGDPALYRSLHQASITNFHSFCYAMMEEDPGYFSVRPDARVAGEVERRRVEAILKSRFDGGTILGVPENPLKEGKGPEALDGFFELCLAVTHKCRSLLIRPEELESAIREEDAAEYRALVASVCAIWREYERLLARNDLLDFTSLTELSVRALEENESLRKRYRSRFDFILVDEFQDTSGAQNELIRLLSDDFSNVMVVGDDRQSIYRWRDARVENIREFQGKTVPLEKNYRSVAAILEAASRFIRIDSYYGSKESSLEPDREGAGTRITLFHPDASIGISPDEEAGAVAAWILGLCRRRDGVHPPLSFGDFAVLMRTLKSPTLEALEKEFSRLSIPYSVLGPGNSLESALLVSLRNVLTLLVRPERIEPLAELLGERPLALDDAALYDLFRTAWEASGKSRREEVLTSRDVLCAAVLDRLSDRETAKKCSALVRTLELLRADLLTMDLHSFVWSAVERSSLLVGLKDRGGTQATEENLVRQLCFILEEMERSGDYGIGSFLDYLDCATRVEDVAAGAEPRLPDDRVKIMTIHQAKGLEFPAVALVGLKERDARGREPSFYVSKVQGLFAKNYEGRDPDDIEEAGREKEGKEQEERCLVYVAMTRARDHLMLSSPVPTDGGHRKASRFLAEIKKCLEEGGIEHREIRNAAGLGRREPAEENVAVVDEREIDRAIAHWERAQERRALASRGALLTGRRFPQITWQGLRAFMHCPLAFAYSYLVMTGDWESEITLDEELSSTSGKDGLVGITPAPDEGALGGDSRPEREGASHGGSGGSGADVPEGIAPASYGELLHRVLEEFFRSAGDTIPDPEGTIADILEEIEHDGKCGKEIIVSAVRLVRAFLSTALGTRKGIEHPEQTFYLRRGDVVFTGRIDRVDIDGDRITVIDYKTGAQTEQHEFQVAFYCRALESTHPGKKIEALLCYLGDDPEMVPVDVKKHADSIDDAVEELVRAHASGCFQPRGGEPCSRCAHAGICGVALRDSLRPQRGSGRSLRWR